MKYLKLIKLHLSQVENMISDRNITKKLCMKKKYYAVIILDNLKHDKLVGKNIEKIA